jgi:predicted DNA-binding transcriptional regulator AlpA
MITDEERKVTRLRTILREPAVLKATGYGKTQLAELVDQGKFPAPIALSPGGRAKGWFEDEVIQYQEQRAAERNARRR